MFSEQIVADCITTLVAFSQASDPAYQSIDQRLIEGLTGRTVEAVHSLCTIENIKNAAPEFGTYNYPTWVIHTAYKKGFVVKDLTGLYTYAALRNMTALENTNIPNDTPSLWELTDTFNDFLYKLKYQAAIELISKISNHRKVVNTSKSLLENLRMYEGGGLFNQRVINKGKFVGFEIVLSRNQNVVNFITQIGIQLDSPVATLPIYVFHSSESDPLFTININATGGLNFNWTAINNVYIKHLDMDPDTGHDTGGAFYIGYYQDDLNDAQAIERQFNIAVAPCRACNTYNQDAYRKWSAFITARAIEVDGEDLLSGAPKLWDTNSATKYVGNTNWGLNLAFSVSCDISGFICENKLLFADAYAKLVALKCIELMANSTRINAISATVKGLAMSELDPKAGSGSLKADYNEALAAIDFDISGFDRSCLACSTRGKISWGAI